MRKYLQKARTYIQEQILRPINDPLQENIASGLEDIGVQLEHIFDTAELTEIYKNKKLVGKISETLLNMYNQGLMLLKELHYTYHCPGIIDSPINLEKVIVWANQNSPAISDIKYKNTNKSSYWKIIELEMFYYLEGVYKGNKGQVLLINKENGHNEIKFFTIKIQDDYFLVNEFREKIKSECIVSFK